MTPRSIPGVLAPPSPPATPPGSPARIDEERFDEEMYGAEDVGDGMKGGDAGATTATDIEGAFAEVGAEMGAGAATATATDVESGTVVPSQVVRRKLLAIQDAGDDLAAVAAGQERQLRQALVAGPDVGVSFLDLCDGPPGGAEAGARRFFNLLSLHMEGVVSVSQADPYGDISVGRGSTFDAWATRIPA
jgi:hypothetical protein